MPYPKTAIHRRCMADSLLLLCNIFRHNLAVVASIAFEGVGLDCDDECRKQLCIFRYTFGLVRAPVLATFSTTVLAQLASVFLIKEAVERLFEVGHHHGTSLPENNHFYFYGAAIASAAALLSATYSVANQPFNYVLRAAQSSVIQVGMY